MSRAVGLSDLAKGLDGEDRSPGGRRLGSMAGSTAGMVLAVAAIGAGGYAISRVSLVPSLGQPQLSEKASSSERNRPPQFVHSKPVQELMLYAQALKLGRAEFDPKISGEELAQALGYTRLFASACEEVARIAGSGAPKAQAAQAFGAVAQEEQIIDLLMARKERVTAIAYLRGLQNGDVTFPAPADWAPTPQALIAQLQALYPEVVLDPEDQIFAGIYRQAREFAVSRVESAGAISVYDVTAQVRRAIVASVEPAPDRKP